MEATKLINEGNAQQATDSTVEKNEQLENNSAETQQEKNKKKHNSALFAASVGRSAVNHAGTHRISRKSGDFAHTGTHITYVD